jgi:isopentenyldiphosphate isomerase
MFDLVYPLYPAPVYPRPSVDHPGITLADASEMLPLVEEGGAVYGQASRAWCHSGSKALHPVVHLHLLDRYGRFCLQKRAAHKDLLPLRWDTSVGGHVTYGETCLEALYREAAEELGLTAFNPIYLGTSIWETPRDREFVVIYAAIGHPALPASTPEVDEIRWWTEEEIDASIGKNVFTPNFEEEFTRLKPSLLALL